MVKLFPVLYYARKTKLPGINGWRKVLSSGKWLAAVLLAVYRHFNRSLHYP